MDLTEADIQEFAALWRQEFGEELSPDRARSEASHFLELYLLLAGFPPP